MPQSSQGSYIIKQQDNILLVDAHGPFNEVTAHEYHQDIIHHTENMCGAPWGSLITFRGNSIFTPDVEEQLRETTQYRLQKGMIAVAVVILNSAYADTQQMQLQQIYRDFDVSFHVFSDTQIAANWLNNFIPQ